MNHLAVQGGAQERDPSRWRMLTARLRRLPDFVIIGAQRGGTTSLYYYLTEHPDVSRALRKEVHFFDRHYDKGMDWYLAHFPTRVQPSAAGEASPNYLIHPEVPRRVHAAIPDAKFIALLRNPADRAYSHYQMKVRRGAETLSFEEAIAQERERLRRSPDPVSSTWRDYSYLTRGLYADQIERWWNVFPREQLLIVKSEDLYAEPERILHQTLAFLGLHPWAPTTFMPYNLMGYPDIASATRARLVDYYAPHNRRLYALLGRDLGWEHE